MLDPIAISTALGLLCRSHGIRVSEPHDANTPNRVYATGFYADETPRFWHEQTAPGWMVTEYWQTWGEGSFTGDYDGPNPLIVLKPVGVPVTVEFLNSVGIVIQSVEWAGPTDLDLNGFIEPADFELFWAWWDAGDLRADWDGNGYLEPADYEGYMNALP